MTQKLIGINTNMKASFSMDPNKVGYKSAEWELQQILRNKWLDKTIFYFE